VGQKQSEINLHLHPRQGQAFATEATELLFGGASRGGKSMFVRTALIIWCTAIPGLQCFIFRRHFDDVVGNHMQSPTGFKALLAPWVRDGLVSITETEVRWPNGSLISLCHLSQAKDLDKHQGREKHVLVFDEATQIPERYLRFLRGWCTMTEEMKARLPDEYKGRFPKVIYTANPFGPSAGYFRKNFVKAAREFEVWRAPIDDGGMLRQFIPARIDDNPSEDPTAARNRLSGIGNANLTDALITGNWDAPGGDYFREYSDRFAPHGNVLKRFKPASHLFKFMTFDWGGADPFAVCWWCVADGEQFEAEDGSILWAPRGALIMYREWYGCDPEEQAKGLRLRNEALAQGIKARTKEATSGLCITDNLPFQDRGFSKNNMKHTIADVFFENGVPLTHGNTQRIQGWSQMRDRLIGIDGSPLLYFSEDCTFAREYVPALGTHPGNPEDAEDSGEATHICDAIRLACTARPLIYDAPLEPEPAKQRTESASPVQLLKRLNRNTSDGSGGRR